jgi:hypothetical protein
MMKYNIKAVNFYDKFIRKQMYHIRYVIHTGHVIHCFVYYNTNIHRGVARQN